MILFDRPERAGPITAVAVDRQIAVAPLARDERLLRRNDTHCGYDHRDSGCTHHRTLHENPRIPGQSRKVAGTFPTKVPATFLSFITTTDGIGGPHRAGRRDDHPGPFRQRRAPAPAVPASESGRR